MVLSPTSTQGYFSCSKMFKTQVVTHETHAEPQKTRNNMTIKETPEGVLQKRRCGPLLISGGGEWLTPGPALLGGYQLDAYMWASGPFNSCCQAEGGFWAAGLAFPSVPLWKLEQWGGHDLPATSTPPFPLSEKRMPLSLTKTSLNFCSSELFCKTNKPKKKSLRTD